MKWKRMETLGKWEEGEMGRGQTPDSGLGRVLGLGGGRK